MTEHGTFRSLQRQELHTSQFNAVMIKNKPKMKAGDCNHGIRVIDPCHQSQEYYIIFAKARLKSLQ
jgi:hypothetical protein